MTSYLLLMIFLTDGIQVLHHQRKKRVEHKRNYVEKLTSFDHILWLIYEIFSRHFFSFSLNILPTFRILKKIKSQTLLISFFVNKVSISIFFNIPQLRNIIFRNFLPFFILINTFFSLSQINRGKAMRDQAYLFS